MITAHLTYNNNVVITEIGSKICAKLANLIIVEWIQK